MFFGSHSSQSPTDTPLLINQDFGELEGAKTRYIIQHLRLSLFIFIMFIL